MSGENGPKSRFQTMKDSDFIVHLERIPPEGLERSLVVEDASAEGFGLAVPQGGPMTVKLSLLKHGTSVLIRGTVDLPVRLDCSRCLKNFGLAVKSDFETCLGTGEEPPSEPDHELLPGEPDVQPLTRGGIDLRPIVAEQVHLALPVKALCSGDCRGLCPTCGKDLNVNICACLREEGDPRWDALKTLKLE